MTYDQFKATMTRVDDLQAAFPSYVWGDATKGGWVFAEYFFVEDASEWGEWACGYGKGRYYAPVVGDDHQSDDLDEVLRLLFDFAVQQGLA